MTNFHSMRREYGERQLDCNTVAPEPIEQFQLWFAEALATEMLDANAMILSTVDEQGLPDSRVLLLKEMDNKGFVFFTDYSSSKGKQLQANSVAAMLFYWPSMVRQVRIKGHCQKLSYQQSVNYFNSRPLASRKAAIVSQQSQMISSRAELLTKFAALPDDNLQCPNRWGGYVLLPQTVEFFQGRNNRLNDRVRYRLLDGHWQTEQLAP